MIKFTNPLQYLLWLILMPIVIVFGYVVFPFYTLIYFIVLIHKRIKKSVKK